MQLLYNSDSFAVVRFDVPAPQGGRSGTSGRGGYEIVDKFARKEIFLEGLLAEHFAAGVKELVDGSPEDEPNVDALDAFIAGYTGLAQQPLVAH